MAKTIRKKKLPAPCVNTPKHSVGLDSKNKPKRVSVVAFLAYFNRKGTQARMQLMKLFPAGIKLEDLQEGQELFVPRTMAAKMQ